MRKFLFLSLVAFSLSSCSDDDVAPQKNGPSGSIPVTGLTHFKIEDLNIPSTGLPDAKRFYTDGSLRASTAYNPLGISTVKRDGKTLMRFYVNPTEGPAYLSGTPYPFHYRAEFSRFPWRIEHPLGTEEWLGFSLIFPTEKEGFTLPRTPVSIYQNHAGSVEGRESNPPALQLEIAYPGQLQSSDPYRQTPHGGEIMICNQILGYRYVAQGARVTPGGRLDIVIQIVYGLGSKGLFNVWINGQLQTFPGKDQLPAGNKGTTVWPENPVGGNWKLGLYHHQLRFQDMVTANAAVGHRKMEMFMTDWKDIVRTPKDPDYKNINAFEAVSTAAN